MAYAINDTISMGQDPYGYDSSSLNRTRNYVNSYNFTRSVNDPIIVSVRWNTSLKENEEPSAANSTYSSGTTYGDVVNVLFDVYQISDWENGANWPNDWTLVGTIRKSRDIRNISQYDRVLGGDGVQTATGHTFTVDISEMCKDLLSYSLVPHGKGTWTNVWFGGQNGGAQPQANLMENWIGDKYLVTKNGTCRRIRVKARCEIIDGNGIIREATTLASSKSMNSNIQLLNTALDYDNSIVPSRGIRASTFVHLGWGTSNRYIRSFQTLCRNGYWGGTQPKIELACRKEVRMDEAAEFLQWNQGTCNNYAIYFSPTAAGESPYNTNNTSDLVTNLFITVVAYDSNGGLLRSGRLFDWTQNLEPKTTINGVTDVYPRNHYRMCVQNVSPVYINANIIHNDSTVQDIWENGGQTYTRKLIDDDGLSGHDALFLNDDVYYYGVYINSITTTQGNGTGATKQFSEQRWYKIDRESSLINSSYNTSPRYYGIYYTELRTDQAARIAVNEAIRCKGFRWNSPRQDRFFRIHWLNKAGGIDSYTFKGYKTESYNAQRDFIQRKEPNRHGGLIGRTASANPYPSANQTTVGNYQSDYVVDNNIYGGTEVLSISGTRSGTVTSRPLNIDKAQWLREILTSPNVWTENLTQDSNGSTSPDFNFLNFRTVGHPTTDPNDDGSRQSGLFGNNMEYVPIVITNSEITTFDEQQGLVTITLEYTHSHAIKTQTN
jgi:hypothetical protein|tara:strand:- start:23920 stop:26079 length:2160 start_codon:yes stop_codon:yes gene_type:complete